MNWMIEGLPETVKVDGVEYHIKSGFRAFLLIDRILKDETLTAEDRMNVAASVFYNENLPENLAEAIKAFQWFQSCGKSSEEERDEEEESKAARKESKAVGNRLKKETGRAIDLDKDSGHIYAAFLETYGIDLTDRSLELHWWKFMMLLNSLPEECKLSRIMFWRTANLSGMSKAQKKMILKMRSIYALDKPKKTRTMDENRKKLAARNRRMIDYVNARFRETGTGKSG